MNSIRVKSISKQRTQVLSKIKMDIVQKESSEYSALIHVEPKNKLINHTEHKSKQNFSKANASGEYHLHVKRV